MGQEDSRAAPPTCAVGRDHAIALVPPTWLVVLARAVVRPLMLCPARVGEEENMAARI